LVRKRIEFKPEWVARGIDVRGLSFWERTPGEYEAHGYIQAERQFRIRFVYEL